MSVFLDMSIFIQGIVFKSFLEKQTSEFWNNVKKSSLMENLSILNQPHNGFFFRPIENYSSKSVGRGIAFKITPAHNYWRTYVFYDLIL